MTQVLLDINVVLDVLQARKLHYENSARVLSLCSEGEIKGRLSALSFGILHYILCKGAGNQKGVATLKKLRSFLRVAAVDERVIDLAIDSDFADFEDAIQYYSALQNGLTHIITRNKKDFAKAKLVVATPEEFLAMEKMI